MHQVLYSLLLWLYRLPNTRICNHMFCTSADNVESVLYTIKLASCAVINPRRVGFSTVELQDADMGGACSSRNALLIYRDNQGVDNMLSL